MQKTMSPTQFILFVKQEINKSKIEKDIYGNDLLFSYTLNFVQLKEHLIFDGVKELYCYINADGNLDLDFVLTYEGCHIAEVEMELKNISNLSFIANQEANNSKEFMNKKYKHNTFNTIYKFELHENNLIVQGKNEDVDFQLKAQIEAIEIELDFIMPISEIDFFEDKEKHTHLFNTLCEIVDDKQLDRISKADYGYKSEECFEDLKQIRQMKTIPKEITFNTSEVLSLTRFSSPEITTEHQECLFACVIIVLGNYEHIQLEDYQDALAPIFIDVNALNNIDLLKQTKALFYHKLQQSNSIYETMSLAYLISGIHLLLKEENEYKKMFDFLNKIELTRQTNYDTNISNTAKMIKTSSEIMLENIDFITDTDLKIKTKNLIKSMILLCKERFNKQAKEAYLKRIFTQEEQEKTINLLPQLLSLFYPEINKILIKKGFNEQQVNLVNSSILKANIYEENTNYNYEAKLNQNIFFDEALKLLGKKLTDK